MPGDTSEVTRPDRPDSAPAAQGVPRLFEWGRLRHLSRDEAALIRKLGGPPAGDVLLDEIAADLAQDLSMPLTLELESVTWVDSPRLLAAPGCFAVIELSPQPGQAVLEIDLGIALGAADRLLGGAGAAPVTRRAPSAVEGGVLSYLILKVLRRAELAWLGAVGLRPRLVSLAARFDAAPGPGVSIRLGARLGDESGTVELWLPEILARSPAAACARARPLPGPLVDVAIDLGVEVARSAFHLEALTRLSVGDVLLFGPAERDTSGRPVWAWLRTRGARGAARARVREADLGFELVLEGYLVEGGPMSEDARTAGGEQLLAEAEIPVTVEMGRLTLPAQEVAALRVGDTLLLGKAPGDALELCAGGKTIARGELVDVDGELGLRLLQIP